MKANGDRSGQGTGTRGGERALRWTVSGTIPRHPGAGQSDPGILLPPVPSGSGPGPPRLEARGVELLRTVADPGAGEGSRVQDTRCVLCPRMQARIGQGRRRRDKDIDFASECAPRFSPERRTAPRGSRGRVRTKVTKARCPPQRNALRWPPRVARVRALGLAETYSPPANCAGPFPKPLSGAKA